MLFLFLWAKSEMGSEIFGSFLILTLLFRPFVCHEQNKDEVFVFEFLQKMGLSDYEFSSSLCSWRGVVCEFKGGNVVKLDASGLSLSGMIPDDTISKLVMLEHLDLSHNEITGLPEDFWSLSSLKTLNLSFNQFSGVLPTNIAYFDQLQSLDLSYNNFSGSIPDAIGSLPSLQALNLSHNTFESTVPLSISQCWYMTYLDLSSNKLSGPLPAGFGSAFSGLKMLNLAGNRIQGRDFDFSGMESIRYLNISDNLFKGSVVHIFQGPLEVMDLSRNQFNGFIAHVNFSSSFNWSNLVYLDISENHFTGELFNELKHSVNLKHLNLANNRFTRQMFFQVAQGSSLQYLNLSGTNLIGPIPDTISHLQDLRILDLSRNNLRGRVPSSVNKNLQLLDLSYNELTGVIPPLLLQIERFNFSYNNLSYCGAKLSNKTVETAFIGSISSCPISADPALFRRKVPSHDTLKFAIYLSLSMVCLLMVLLCVAFRSRYVDRMWAVKLKSCKDEESISRPFSFKRDSTTWTDDDVKQATSVPVVIFEKPLLNFTFADLLSATSHFDRAALLSEGRFGPVYRALLPGDIHVAVQVLVQGSATMCDQDATRELEYLGGIKHPNLVPLAGYCLAGEQMIAIYDYMEGGNLQNLLHTTPLCDPTTEETISEDDENGIQNVGSESIATCWKFRYNVALGTARALAFLHHGCVPPMIHGNVKASSIFLDTNLEPRLSDFGLAKILGNGHEDEDLKGSPYMPPEFVQQDSNSPYVHSPKFDVYGYGVILFELITGKKPIEDDYPDDEGGNLVGWMRGLVRRNEASKAIDPKIEGTWPEAKMAEALKIGYLCTAENPWKRPTMHQVVGLLKDLEQGWLN